MISYYSSILIRTALTMMIKNIEFSNFRNLRGKYDFDNILNVIIGKNNSGKTNLLDGIRFAFSTITNDYFKINQSDFYNSDDSLNIQIKVELRGESIPSLDFYDLDEQSNQQRRCGFIVTVKKTQSGKYVKDITLLNGSNIDFETLREDPNIPNVFYVPLLRIDEIYTNGLVTGISKFIESEEKYQELKEDSKNKIKAVIKDKVDVFKAFCKKFNQDLDIALTEPKISDEKVFIVEEGQKEHNYKIGSGYRSIANIILNTLNDNYNIILIDEIENHLHPSLIRTIVRELQLMKNTQIVATSHSPIIINELKLEEIVDINYKKLVLTEDNFKKLNIFMHPGRSEIMLADNVILVEGYTEELLLRQYLRSVNYNWNVVNVAGVMFEPYIELAKYLHKNIVVVSDDDKALSDTLQCSSRFTNLEQYCKSNNVCLIEVENTLETDLYNNGYLADCTDLLMHHEKHNELLIAKKNCKIEIAERIIEKKIDLSDWHVIKGIINEFESH